MPALKNVRHEAFVLELAKGKTADEAYQAAGYARNRGNAARLKASENILARLAELQARTARKTEITLGGLVDELDVAIEQASRLGHSNVLVSATALKARLAGLDVKRVEVGGPGDFAGCQTPDEIMDKLMAELGDEPLAVLDMMRAGVLDRLADRAKLPPLEPLPKADEVARAVEVIRPKHKRR